METLTSSQDAFIYYMLGILGLFAIIVGIIIYKGVKDCKNPSQFTKENEFIYFLQGKCYDKHTILEQVEYWKKNKGARSPMVHIYKLDENGINSDDPIRKISVNDFNSTLLW